MHIAYTASLEMEHKVYCHGIHQLWLVVHELPNVSNISKLVVC